MSNILTRTIWGAVFIVITIGAIVWGFVPTLIVLSAFMCLSIYEFHLLFKNSEESNSLTFIGTVGGLLLFIIFGVNEVFPENINLFIFIIPILFLPFLILVFNTKAKQPLTDLALTFFSWIYIVLPFYFMFKTYTYSTGDNRQWLFLSGFFFLVWANDTFAYLAGRFFGKHKLHIQISPKKTWEGAIGGFIFTIIIGVIYTAIFDKNYLFWITAAIVISPMSVLGDLIESRLKRLTNIKDSGKIIPGHGGILDRFDASLYAIPFFYILMTFFF